jgi:acyl-CoA synthetase (NDP forming)
MKAAIDRFLASKAVAVVGTSEAKGSFGGTLFREFRKRGMTVYPVNPRRRTMDGVPCFSSVADLPAGIEAVVTAIPPAATEQVVEACVAREIPLLWMVNGSSSPTAITRAEGAGMAVIHGECPLMFLEPVRGGHAMHRWFLRVFGRLPH